MAVSKGDMGEKNAMEYQEGARRARNARKNVAGQLAHLIESGDLTGSHPYVARRIQAYADAVRNGDHLIVRSALMDLGTAVGVTVAALDLESPPEATV